TKVAQSPREPLHQTPTPTSRVCRQKHRSLEPDCPLRSSPPGTPETVFLARDRSPQRSAPSDPSATAESHCEVNHIKRVFTHPGSFATGSNQQQVQPCPLCS